MTKKLAKTDGYALLVSKIRKELEGLELLFKRETVLGYWRVGQYISEHLLENKQRADYGGHFYELLAQDTGRHKTLLTRAVKFYHTYRIVAPGQQLTWSHYRALLGIEDKSQRKRLERLAIAKDWDSRELAKYIKARKQKEKGFQPLAEIPQLAFTRGRLQSYRLLEPELLPSGQESELLIDLGFRMRREFPESKALGLKAGDCIRLGTGPNSSTSVSPGTGLSTNSKTSLKIEKISATLEELFTYVACVQKIIDGDTLWALIDAGFGRLIQQKLRFRGIDCPELSTPEGQRAKRFVQERLKNLDFIIIKTYKDRVDKYDRYLVDLFYLPTPRLLLALKLQQASRRVDSPLELRRASPQKVLEQGIFLNQELLDKGLATLV